MWSSKRTSRLTYWNFAASIALLGALAVHANAAEDLSQLRVTPQRNQTAEQARRDRYECHNWAVEESGETPVAVPTRTREPTRRELREERRKRAERVDKIVNGAVIGAGLGGIVRSGRDHNPAEGVLAGAAVGAAIGAAVGRDKDRDADDGADVAQPSGYLRALSACMEGRGYSIELPGSTELVARR